MKASSPRWQEITPSEHPWEREALAYVRERLPDFDPYRAWATFEFISGDGKINEVDLLVLSPTGLFLVEIKSWPGTLSGDVRDWVVEHEGRRRVLENPLFLTDRKSKRLSSLLAGYSEFRRGTRNLPFVQPLVFLSAPALTSKMSEVARQHVYLRDESPKGRDRDGIVWALTSTDAPRSGRKIRIDRPTMHAVVRALEEAGIRPSQRSRQIGDYVLDEPLRDGPGFQDFAAHHVGVEGDKRRVRIYGINHDGTDDERDAIFRAARREYQLLSGITHPGIARPLSYTETELGPALIYDFDPAAQTLGAFLSESGDRLSIEERLRLIRDIAETVRYAHDRGIVHRALSPESIEILDMEKERLPRILDWQTSFRAEVGTIGHTRGLTSHADVLVSEAAVPYLAPEAITVADTVGPAVDVFSLGMLAYRIVTGSEPGAPEPDGLDVAAVLNGAPELLRIALRFATAGNVEMRTESVAAFLDDLADAERDLHQPDTGTLADPTSATTGDELEGGLLVVERLGSGATSHALLVERDNDELVLKVARDADQDERLRDEAEVLRQLSHACIVRMVDTITVDGRAGLLLERAGEVILGDLLRSDGRLHLDMLERWGEDLLDSVRYLESVGTSHRDIKPDNLGIRERAGSRQKHLVLFDFSLARAPVSNVRAGTTGYLDPFVSKRGVYDLHAERFSAAVTLYEMATGELPHWGDGRSDPAQLDCEVTIDESLFEPSLAPALESFFRQALAREVRDRFGTADDMLRGWRRVFEAADKPAIAAEDDTKTTDPDDAAARAALDDPLVGLGVSPRVIELFARVGAATVHDALRIQVGELTSLSGIGDRTRREARALLQALRGRFPDALEEHLGDPAVMSVDIIARRLVPRGSSTDAGQERLASVLLGLDAGSLADPAGSRLGAWGTTAELADVLEVDLEDATEGVDRARRRWERLPELTALRDDLARLLEREGGVMTADELASAVLALRGSTEGEPGRSQNAAAAARAADEVERSRASTRWALLRHEGSPVLALVEPSGAAAAELDPLAIAQYAVDLGLLGDELGDSDPLLSPQQAIARLRVVATPEGLPPLTDARIVRLAAAASSRAAVSGRLELYPRGLSVAKALELSRGALLGRYEKLDPKAVSERVRSRFPEAEPIPGRPVLDELLKQAGIELLWDPAQQGYVLESSAPISSTRTLVPTRLPTTLGALIDPDDPELEPAVVFERRISTAAQGAGFLCLVARESEVMRAASELVDRFQVNWVSLDRIFLHYLKLAAAQLGASWDVVLRADAAERDSVDWTRLKALVGEAIPGVEEEIGKMEGVVLVTDVGLLVRYDQLSLIDRLRDQAGKRGSTLRTLWLLIPGDPSVEWPLLDGAPIPVIGPTQWIPIPSAWIANRHRGRTAA